MDKIQAALDVLQENIVKEYGTKGLEALTVKPEQATPWQTMTTSEIASTETGDSIWIRALVAQL